MFLSAEYGRFLSKCIYVSSLYSPSTFVTGIWRWRIHCLMEVTLHGLRFVILVIQRYPEFYCTQCKIVLGIYNCMFVFAVHVIAFPTKINRWHTRLHCSGSVISERIWWPGIVSRSNIGWTAIMGLKWTSSLIGNQSL